MTAAELRRARAFVAELGRLMLEHGGRRPELQERTLVDDFRERYLGGALDTPEQARYVLGSKAAHFLTLGQFQEFGIPVGVHKSSGPPIGPPFLDFKNRLARYEITLSFTWPGGGKATHSVQWEQEIGEGETQSFDPNWTPWTRMRDDLLVAAPGSVLDALFAIARELADYFLVSPRQAAEFILSGHLEPSEVIFRFRAEAPGKREGAHDQERIGVLAPPWIGESTVARVYRQYRLYALRLAGAVGWEQTTVRHPVARRVRLFNFVAARRHANPDESWHEIRRVWNRSCKKNPADRYADSRHSNFHRDYRAAHLQIMGKEAPRDRAKPPSRKRADRELAAAYRAAGIDPKWVTRRR